MITLEGITLPSDLEWTDEYTWSPVAQTQQISLSGSVIIQEQEQQAGRPVTLEGGNNAAWVTKQTLDQIKALADTADTEMTLDYHGQIMTVIFNRQDSRPYTARLIQRIANPQSSAWYSLTLRLTQVAQA